METYPEFTVPSALPRAARMLLDNDGSTTLLLQSLVGSALCAEVLAQTRGDAPHPSDHVVRTFGADPRTLVGVRRSRLRDRTGRAVSENVITFHDRDGAALIPTGTTPFGLHVRDLGLFERRRILEAGVTTDRFGLLPAGSPGRVYEIEFSNEARVLVHEVFNELLFAPEEPAADGAATGEHHQPRWPDQARAASVRGLLARMPALVTAAESLRLRGDLAAPGFLLHAGDCAETFRENTPSSVAGRLGLLGAMSQLIERASGTRVVRVGRIAGQYAKPRSAKLERSGETALASYLGDAVNSVGFSRRERTPEPGNLIRAYRESSKTLSFMAGSGVYASHEALLLDYELPQTRRGAQDGRRYDHSAHLLWIGERTRSVSGPHIRFAASIENPVAVKLGPSCTRDDLLALHEALNPRNLPGRLTFILRMGRAQAYDRVRALLEAAVAEGLSDRFVSDPMHGNTVASPSGVKTRSVWAIEQELRAFFEACRDTGAAPGGVHLELTADTVTECVGREIDEDYLAGNYSSACDPRLNPAQSLRIAGLVGELLAAASAVPQPDVSLTV